MEKVVCEKCNYWQKPVSQCFWFGKVWRIDKLLIYIWGCEKYRPWIERTKTQE
jgi:hypothetical protein